MTSVIFDLCYYETLSVELKKSISVKDTYLKNATQLSDVKTTCAFQFIPLLIYFYERTAMPISTENIGPAFIAVFAAGASTCLGASVVFFPRLVKLTSKNFLASSLGISAGVMTYVSFVEIFQKSQHAFISHLEDMIQDEDKKWGRANLFATISFFSGVVIMIVSYFHGGD